MATRQYIGARYVPKFYVNGSGTSEWTANTAYEALTIVTRNGNSYTSKKPVPANIGAPETAQDYWVSTGIYNQQVEQYRQEVETLAENLSDFETSTENRFDLIEDQIKIKRLVIFGDSWADTDNTTYLKWPTRFDSNKVIVSANYAKNGSSLSGSPDQYGLNGNVGGQIAYAASDTSYDKNSITDIVLMGGVNDFRNGITSSDVAIKCQDHITRLKTLYPHARMVFFINYQIYVTVEELKFCSFLQRELRRRGLEAWHMLAWLAAGNFIEDKIHPSNDGYTQIYTNIMAVLFGGSPVRVPIHTSYSFTHNNASLSLEINEEFTDEGYSIFPSLTVSNAAAAGQADFVASDYKQNGCCFLTSIGNLYLTSHNPANLQNALVYQTYDSVDASHRGTGIKFSIGYPGNGTFLFPVSKRIAQ